MPQVLDMWRLNHKTLKNTNMKEKLYIVDGDKAQNIKELLSKFFSLAATSGCVSTYYNKECTKLHTGAGRNRSFGDIFGVAKTYFPNITDEEVAYTLLNLDSNNFKRKKSYLCWLYCSDINKGVFLLGDYDNYSTQFFNCQTYHKHQQDNVGEDGYSFNDIVSLANTYKKNLNH